MTKPIQIILVDDHQMVLDGLKLIMEGQDDIHVVDTFANGKEALDFVKKEAVDLVLMDLNMPEMNGMEASKLMKAANPDVKIIILSMLSDTKLVKKLVKDGINGYLLKNSGQDEIISAIHMVMKGQNHFDPKVMELLLGSSKDKQVKSENLMPSLSRREKEILGLILEELTSSEIAKKLYIGLGTVESHRRNMISKLGVRNTAGLVKAAYEYELLN